MSLEQTWRWFGLRDPILDKEMIHILFKLFHRSGKLPALALSCVILLTTSCSTTDKNDRKIIKEAAIESAKYQRKLWEESEKKALEELKKAGVKIVYLNKEPFWQDFY